MCLVKPSNITVILNLTYLTEPKSVPPSCLGREEAPLSMVTLVVQEETTTEKTVVNNQSQQISGALNLAATFSLQSYLNLIFSSLLAGT